MLIIVEGADKTGKTTLCQAIVKKFGCRYIHFSKPKKRAANEYADLLLSPDEDRVCDRFHLGELVYAPILNRDTQLDDVEFVTIERLLRLKQAILIQTTTDSVLANKRLLVSTQYEAVDQRQNQLAAQGFKNVINRSNVKHIFKYDGSSYDNLNELLNKLAALKDEVERDQATIRNVCTGIGTPTGKKIVLVGEAVNQKVTWLGLPFDKGFSSQFLLDSLKAAGVPENLVYVCNADKLTAAEINFLTKDKTLFISLGKKADTRLSFLDVPHKVLPHPQYIKRFQWKNKGQYTKDLKNAIKGF